MDPLVSDGVVDDREAIDADGGERSDLYTAEDDLSLLTAAWVNEKMAPDLLPFEENLVVSVKDRLDVQVC